MATPLHSSEHPLTVAWYDGATWLQFLRPVSWLFRLVVSARRAYYRRQQKISRGVNVMDTVAIPVIVVGNITVGGSGKTPLLMAIAEELKQRGHRIGIVSRGYGGNTKQYPLLVDDKTPPALCGDEPAMMARRLGVPVIVDPDRKRAIHAMGTASDYPCDVILSDDGLQHYAMVRDIEMVVVDAERCFGNGLCLPAGPLREPLSRLRSIDYLISNGVDTLHRLPRQHTFITMHLKPVACVNLATGERITPEKFFRKQMLHVVAGIGNPRRFFTLVKDLGSQVVEHPFPDHYAYRAGDLHFGDALPILMTEKDAVKCKGFSLKNAWYLEVKAELPEAFYQNLLERLSALQSTRNIAVQRGLFDER